MSVYLPAIPPPTNQRLALRVTAAAERALRDGHPWLFEQSITEQNHEGQPGDLAVVFDRKNRFLAVGLYDPTSPIRVRLLQHGQPATIDEEFFRKRLSQAADRRAALPENTTGYRLVHGPNDGLPGLVVDRYADTLVLKLYAVSWLPHLPALLSALGDVVPAGHQSRLVLRLSRALQNEEAFLHGLYDGQILHGPPLDDPLEKYVVFQENGLRFAADPVRGQKTGFFLDQRDNRFRVEELVHETNARRVLNVFAYSGGFSLYAARGGATSVTSLDISQHALDEAAHNFALNAKVANIAAAQHTLLAGDAFQELGRLGDSGARFDLVVVDPPAFAKRANEVAGALAAYARLTKLALGVLRSGGVLVSASCSSRVGADDFFAALHRAAREAGRPLEEIERTGHALDHPIGFAQGAYLKCLFARA